jgi:hypothetical protein
VACSSRSTAEAVAEGPSVNVSRVPTAGFCPYPPLLVRGATGARVAEVEELREACARVVHRLVATSPSPITVVGPDPTAAPGAEPTRWPSSSRGSLAGLGIPGESDGGAPLPLSLAVGRALLSECGVDEFASQLTVAQDAPATQCLALGRSLRDTTLLVLADGSSRRGHRAPGGRHPLADSYDARVALALESGDAGALAELDAPLGAELGVSGRATWQALAGWADGRAVPPAPLAYCSAPFGVGYLAGSWSVG